jgi:methionyl-tRNA synthetase
MKSNRNEVIAFVSQGLKDLSISRTTIQWGIPVPDEEKHVFYVWFDALTTYLSAVSSGAPGSDTVNGEPLWPADLHLIGKEIVRFHAIYWPAFLWAAGLPIPKRIFAHGWLLFENDKMSKSRGNIVRATPIRDVMGVDALRYSLLREIHFGQDGSFSFDALVGRFNSDLANGLGNLASRTLSMIRQYRAGAVPASAGDAAIAEAANTAIAQARASFDEFAFSRGLDAVWGLIAAADKFIVERAPWKLVKDPAAAAQLDETLYTAAEVVRIVSVLLAPVMPDSAAKIWAQLGCTEPLEKQRIDQLAWGQWKGGQQVGEPATVFPRVEVGPAVEQMRMLEEKETARQKALLGQKDEAPAAPAGKRPEAMPPITIDDFVKVDLRVGEVKTAERVKGADKLLHLSVDIGEAEPRSIVAGIALAYEPEKLIGRKVVIVANLEPRKLRGITSQGMIVAASLEGGSPVLTGFLEDVPVGARLK